MKTVPTGWSAVVLGGGDPGDAFAAANGARVKALIPIQGVPMGLYVLRALQESGVIRQVAYVGPTTPEMDGLIQCRVTDRGSLLSNLEAGVLALHPQPGERVLVVTADIPLLSAQELREVLEAAPNASLVYPVVRREDCEAAYPGVKRTYARLQDGTFTGGNLFLLDPALIGRFLPRLREVLGARKQPLKLASLIGLDTLFKLLFGRLTVSELESKVSQLLGVPARALMTHHAAIGTDVDKESDLSLIQQEMNNRVL